MDNKSIHIQLTDNEQWILAHTKETVLHSLLEHGVAVRHACTNGACGVCLTQLIDGEVDYQGRTPHGLNKREREMNYFLPCIARCKSHITIAPPPTPAPKR